MWNLSAGDFLTQSVVIAVSIAIVFCLSAVALIMCIFCNTSNDEKDLETGYVGKINLADIQVFYNHATGLTHLNRNEEFGNSNPGVLVQGSVNVPQIPPNNKIHQLREEPRKPQDVGVDKRYKLQLQYENLYTDIHSNNYLNRNKDRNYKYSPEKGQHDVVYGQKNFLTHTNKSPGDWNSKQSGQKHDLTIKNTHVRYL